MNLIDQLNNTPCGRYDQAKQSDYAQRDYAQPLLKLPVTTPQKPSMGSKLSKVAEIFELDIIDEAEALKACKTIIEQHAKVGKVAITTAKIADSVTTQDKLGGNNT